MASGNLTIFQPAKTALLSGSHNLATENVVAVLLTASYTPSLAHATWADVSAYEAAGTGYTAGGVLMGSNTLAASGNNTTFTCGGGTNPQWAASTITAKYVVLVRRAGASLVSGDLLLGYADLSTAGGSVSTTNGDFDGRWTAQQLTLS